MQLARSSEASSTVRLCVNIDHVATIRQARRTHEPDPVEAAVEAETGGADGITVHLREDRRHIQDADLPRLKSAVRSKLNLEMAATDEMVRIAIALKPHMAMFVPENRLEVTTEGGLDVASQESRLRERVRELADAGIPASAFIDADERQIEAAARAGFAYCEVHTGPYAHAAYALATATQCHEASARATAEFERVVRAVACIGQAGMFANAGHALHYNNVRPIAAIAGLQELHIGHAIVSRAVFVGMREAVSRMKAAMC